MRLAGPPAMPAMSVRGCSVQCFDVGACAAPSTTFELEKEKDDAIAVGARVTASFGKCVPRTAVGVYNRETT